VVTAAVAKVVAEAVVKLEVTVVVAAGTGLAAPEPGAEELAAAATHAESSSAAAGPAWEPSSSHSRPPVTLRRGR
jgi:hypothetical protein